MAKKKKTRTNLTPEQEITHAQDLFIGAWGKMGSAWGISRTMAEVHALLYISGEPQCTDDVMDRLQISRGNASMSLRSLEDWGLIHRVHKRGDRKDYFEAEDDVWTMFRTIMRERKKRELDPIVASLFEIRDITQAKHAQSDAVRKRHNKRLDNMLQLIQTLERLGQTLAVTNDEALRAAATAFLASEDASH